MAGSVILVFLFGILIGKNQVFSQCPYANKPQTSYYASPPCPYALQQQQLQQQQYAAAQIQQQQYAAAQLQQQPQYLDTRSSVITPSYIPIPVISNSLEQLKPQVQPIVQGLQTVEPIYAKGTQQGVNILTRPTYQAQLTQSYPNYVTAPVTTDYGLRTQLDSTPAPIYTKSTQQEVNVLTRPSYQAQLTQSYPNYVAAPASTGYGLRTQLYSAPSQQQQVQIAAQPVSSCSQSRLIQPSCTPCGSNGSYGSCGSCGTCGSYYKK